MDDIQKVAERNGVSVRVYKTAAGYRASVTNSPREAAASQTEALLQRFGADPLYIRLPLAGMLFRASHSQIVGGSRIAPELEELIQHHGDE